MSEDEKRFHQMLQILADHCSFTLSKVTIALYDEALKEHGYRNAGMAMKAIFTKRRGGDRFPSIADILAEMGIEVSDRSRAVDCSNTILWALANWKMEFYGREDFDQQFILKLGDYPWEVVTRMGGYRALFNEWNESKDIAILRAQIRDAALSVLEFWKADDQKQMLAGAKAPQIEGK